MNNIEVSDIYNLISNLMCQETHNYNNYMKNNPQDTQRTYDHILIQSTYCKVLYMLNQMNVKE